MKTKRLLILLFSMGLVLSFNACGKTESTEKGTDRPEYVPEVSDEDEAFVDTDGDFTYETVDWNGPEGYVIVVPDGNSAAMKSAETLKKYYSESLDISLEIVTDKTTETDKEILIGRTNRSQSRSALGEASLEVAIKDSKLIINGGHDVTVDSAVQKFVRLAPAKNKACTFQLDTDFVTTMLDGYEYVWGDEFEGTGVDRSKWAYTWAMSGTDTMQLSSEENVMAEEDGRLKLRAIRYFDPTTEGVKYRVPYTVSTLYNMSFVYGYIEIRARLPFQSGGWPGFWMGNNTNLSKYAWDKGYSIEIDIFENFGSLDTIIPNLHKHYDDGRSIQWPTEKSSYTFDNSDGKLYQEYHTYGCELTPTEISMYVDGVKYQTFDISKSFDDNPDMAGFNTSMHVMFNNHLFVEDSDWIVNLVDCEELPTEFFIDYIRLYQKPGQGKLWTDDTIL